MTRSPTPRRVCRRASASAPAGTITGTLPANASVAGPYTITVTATDAQGATVTDTFIWTGTNPSPTVSPIADQSSVEGAAVNLDVAPNFADDDALTYTASGLPVGLSISAAGTITGTLPADASVAGPYTITVTATDAQGATVTDTFTWTGTNPSPTVSPIADQSSVEGAAVNLDVAPNFADDDAITYTATGLPAGLSISAGGTITGTLPANASVAGPYTITVTATDAQGATVTDTFIWTGTNPSPTVSPIADQSSVEGAAVNLDVAPNFADDDALTYTASGLPVGLSISAAGTITGTLAGRCLGRRTLYDHGHRDRRARGDGHRYVHLDRHEPGADRVADRRSERAPTVPRSISTWRRTSPTMTR